MPPTAIPTANESDPPRASKDMNGWKIFRKAVPEGDLWAITELSKLAGVSIDTVYRWMRPPSTSKKPKSTGRRNPCDYIGQVLCALYAVSPDGAEEIFDAFDDLRAELRARHGQAPKLRRAEMKNKLRQGARQLSQMADAIAGESDDD